MSALHTLNLGTYVATSDWMEPLVEAIQLLTLAILLHDGTYGPPQVWPNTDGSPARGGHAGTECLRGALRLRGTVPELPRLVRITW